MAHPHHIDPLSLPFTPIPPSSSPDATVKLTLLHCGELTANRVMWRQRDTLEEMAEHETAVIFAAVIEKTVDGKTERWMWDLGIVSDLSKLGPEMEAAMRPMATLNVPPSAQLPELLTHLSPPPATLDTLTGIILSHAHVDHAGALNEFPAELPVIAAPGTKTWMDRTPDAEKPIPAWFWSHPKFIGEVGEEGAKGKGKAWESIGSYERAWNFFGDGSLWLMQAPGHCPGHQVALCRVSTYPDTYVLFGGDTCHSRYIYTPFPTPVARSDVACWAHPAEGPADTTKGTHTMHTDLKEAYKSIARLTRMEMEDDIMCVLAHETMYSEQAHHVDPQSLAFVPIPASASPDAIVKLTALNVGELNARFVQFRQRDTLEEMKAPELIVIFSWVVEKIIDGKMERWMWDMGLVSDKERLGPELAREMDSRFVFNVPPSAQLPELYKRLSPPPATLDTLSGLILSHVHVDHYGALDEFPAEIPLIVGPGTKAWVDTSSDDDRPIPLSFWKHPKVISEVGEEGARGRGKQWQKVGSFDKGWDFFGDGSMWIMQAPGHCPGHQVALCRVSTSPDTYVLLSGDTCHSRYIYSPFPGPDLRSDVACWVHPSHGPPGSEKGETTMHVDLEEAYRSIARLTRMEMEDNVICIVAHETEMARELDLGIGQMKQGWDKWKENGWKKGKESGIQPTPISH
ncbi:hypothetical protein CALCODRAFT_517617 [Calocera cornea HHB12733]|uniref:Metallo-beta-lactamase domain-containing protein n=1 Tax=Calocera cornea HHB12733 TaxID=1353952 RepID=A0A165FSA5_9BASI|nr:hypothetical protein CALCODRAFT_517617 [Calocera cornea HHB12733]